MVQPLQQSAGAAIVGTRLDGQDALPHRGHEHLRVQRLRVRGGQPEARQTGCGEQHSVEGAALESAEPRIDVAADGLDHEVRPKRQREGTPAGARGAQHRARAQVLEARPFTRHENVARVRALGKRRERQTGRKIGGQVLEAVDGAVEGTGQEHLLDLADEEPLAAHVGQSRVQTPVALRPHRHDLDLHALLAQGGRDRLGVCPVRRRDARAAQRDLHARAGQAGRW